MLLLLFTFFTLPFFHLDNDIALLLKLLLKLYILEQMMVLEVDEQTINR